MSISSSGISDLVNTTDGRAVGIVANNSSNGDHIGGAGLVDRYGSQPTGTRVLLTQGGDYIDTQASDRLTTE